jgi:hypothetical protein
VGAREPVLPQTAAHAVDHRRARAARLLEQGVAVAVNLRRHGNLMAWAKERGLFVRVDRATPWGSPFVIGRDGDRATVIARSVMPARSTTRLLAHRGQSIDLSSSSVGPLLVPVSLRFLVPPSPSPTLTPPPIPFVVPLFVCPSPLSRLLVGT